MQDFKDVFSLEDTLIQGLDAIGYKQPLPIQQEVIPKLLSGQDVIVQSHTGSGKTAAFLIPMAQQIDVTCTEPQGLILAPTRELAVQIAQEMTNIGKYKHIRTLAVYGKQPIHIQLRQLKQRVHVVVGTPGRLLDLIKRKNLSLDHLTHLVIDEADELLKKGFMEEVTQILQKLPSEKVSALFSATMPPTIEGLCETFLVNPLRIEGTTKAVPVDQIKQSFVNVSEDWKFLLLRNTLANLNPSSCLIFCNTRAKTDDLYAKLRRGGYPVIALHGGMAQRDRLRAIDQFKSGQHRYLVTTDLAARGLHIDALDLVINYQVPLDPENYVHRIGRTGRVDAIGSALTFVSEYELKRLADVTAYIGYTIPEDKNPDLTNEPKPKPKHVTKGASSGKPVVKHHQDIMRLRINVGKNKKMRAGDVLGAISNLPGIQSADIGIIDIQDTCTYVEIFNQKGLAVEEGLSKTKVKGRDVTVKKVR